VLAIEANRSIFVDRKEVFDFADKNGIVIVGLLDEDLAEEEYRSKNTRPCDWIFRIFCVLRGRFAPPNVWYAVRVLV
jgi:Uncharacterized protein conserved in bacteria